jgi:hypothetical protein
MPPTRQYVGEFVKVRVPPAGHVKVLHKFNLPLWVVG